MCHLVSEIKRLRIVVSGVFMIRSKYPLAPHQPVCVWSFLEESASL